MTPFLTPKRCYPKLITLRNASYNSPVSTDFDFFKNSIAVLKKTNGLRNGNNEIGQRNVMPSDL